MRCALFKFGDVVAEYNTVTTGAGPVGAEGSNRYVRDFIRATPNASRCIVSLAPAAGELTAGDDSVRVIAPATAGFVGRNRNLALLVSLFTAARHLVRFGPDVIVCMDSGPPALMCLAVAAWTRSRLVYAVTTAIETDGLGGRLRGMIARATLGSRRVDGILACTPTVKEAIEQRCRPRVPVAVYYPDLSAMYAEAAPPLAAVERAHEVLYVGRLAQVKGVDRLPGIAAALACVEGYTLAIAGSGPAEDELVQSIANSGASHAVTMLGPLTHEQALERMARARLVVVPSYSEGVAKVALESLMAATPVVAFRVGGIPDTVTDGVDGLLLDPSDVDGIGRTVASLCADDSRWTPLASGAATFRERLRDEARPTYGDVLARVMGDVRLERCARSRA